MHQIPGKKGFSDFFGLFLGVLLLLKGGQPGNVD